MQAAGECWDDHSTVLGVCKLDPCVDSLSWQPSGLVVGRLAFELSSCSARAELTANGLKKAPLIRLAQGRFFLDANSVWTQHSFRREIGVLCAQFVFSAEISSGDFCVDSDGKIGAALSASPSLSDEAGRRDVCTNSEKHVKIAKYHHNFLNTF